jgi:hypothetical protein
VFLKRTWRSVPVCTQTRYWACHHRQKWPNPRQGSGIRYNSSMGTLPEIEAAIEALPPADKQELLLFLAARLREQAGDLPAPRKFSACEVQTWIDEDDADLERFRNGRPE